MTSVHWLGAGLSTFPGIQRLANSGIKLCVWNRTLDKALAAVADTTGARAGTAIAKVFDLAELAAVVASGDVLVSMLPGNFHVQIAELALEKKAHFVSSSYISPEMKALSEKFRIAGLMNVNEVGLDPGIDHLFAHSLVSEYKQAAAYRLNNEIFFRSYCGGVPAIPNDFTYKFSWSPLGVLKALKSRAQWLDDGHIQATDTPWKAVSLYQARVSDGKSETFEAYANRDSLPFRQAYGFADDWNTRQFVRGTLRLYGWRSAWQYLFDEIESLEGPAAEQRLIELSDALWHQYQYAPGEPDRVVLCVELEARDRTGSTVWHHSYNLDEIGHEQVTAMAKLVSLTVSLAVESVLAGEPEAGVTAAPASMALVKGWLNKLTDLGVSISRVDHLVH